MHVSDLTEQRRQMLPRGVTFTKHPSHLIMMVITMGYHLRLQIGIHLWVLIHQVMNCTQSIPINLVHICLLDINSSSDCSGLTQIQNQIHFLKKPARQKMDWSYLLARTYLQTFESRGKNCFTKIQCGSYSKVQVLKKFAETNFVNELHEDTQRNSPSSNEDDELQECQEYNTDQDLEPHNDDLLDFISHQEHSGDQLDQVLQNYQAYQESQSESLTPTRQLPTRQLNTHIISHVAQATCGSLVDRGANGGLAGVDVRVLSTSPRKYTVTGIDNHEIPGLTLVQCASLVQTNYGLDHLIMNEYAYFGRGHSIHSSGQIEWYQHC